MKQYLDLLKDILENGEDHSDRTGVGRRSWFGPQIEFDLSQGFPATTTKKLYMKGVIHELLWFLKGDTNIRYLRENNVGIWDDWPYKAYCQARQRNSGLAPMTQEEFVKKIVSDYDFAQKWGDLGPVYGAQWRHWDAPDGKTIDQISNVIAQIKQNPHSARHIVNAWNVARIEEMAKSGLPPCHCLFQFFVSTSGKLSCKLYQRSADMLLGVPFNIASYALLTLMVAHVTGLQPGRFIHTFGDAHIYLNHFDQVREQLSREPRPLPRMEINPDVKDISAFTYADFTLTGYDPYPAIKAPIAV